MQQNKNILIIIIVLLIINEIRKMVSECTNESIQNKQLVQI